jgi:hypothetical protein
MPSRLPRQSYCKNVVRLTLGIGKRHTNNTRQAQYFVSDTGLRFWNYLAAFWKGLNLISGPIFWKQSLYLQVIGKLPLMSLLQSLLFCTSVLSAGLKGFFE